MGWCISLRKAAVSQTGFGWLKEHRPQEIAGVGESQEGPLAGAWWLRLGSSMRDCFSEQMSKSVFHRLDESAAGQGTQWHVSPCGTARRMSKKETSE